MSRTVHITGVSKKLLAGEADLDFVENFDHFLQKITEKPFQYDAVLSDIFFPTGDEHKDHNVPAGVGVFFICRDKKIPCVLVTAGNHHGKDYEWVWKTVHNIIPMIGLVSYKEPWPLADCLGVGDGEAPEKRWKRAFEQLSEQLSLIVKK